MKLRIKFSGEIKAVEVKDPAGIIALKGQFIVFDTNDNIYVMEKDEIKRFFSIHSSASTKKRSSNSGKTASGRRAALSTALRAPAKIETETLYAKVLSAFGPDNGGNFAKDLTTRKISEITGIAQERIAGSLVYLTYGGFLERTKSPKDGVHPPHYLNNLSLKGIEALRKLKRSSK